MQKHSLISAGTQGRLTDSESSGTPRGVTQDRSHGVVRS
jgi:hypothetical protein